MYQPRHFIQTDVQRMHALMRAWPFATLVTSSDEGPEANHLPLLLDAEPAPLGRLRGHIARANPLFRQGPAGRAALIIFHGPDAYVSPSWYPSKAETGKVVPTWNYAVVHARARLRLIEDRAWLRALLAELTDTHEAGRPSPWRVGDAPADYIEQMIGAVIGVELDILDLQGKWKLSQNQPEHNRAGVRQALAQQGDTGQAMLNMMEEGPDE